MKTSKVTSFLNIQALDQLLEKQAIAICEIVTTQAKSLAPVDKGMLRASIMYKTAGGKSGGLEGGPRLTSEPKVGGGVVGSNVDYAVYQEFGTRHMAPQPFLRPAVEIARKGNTAEVLKKIERENAKGPLTNKKRVRFN